MGQKSEARLTLNTIVTKFDSINRGNYVNREFVEHHLLTGILANALNEEKLSQSSFVYAPLCAPSDSDKVEILIISEDTDAAQDLLNKILNSNKNESLHEAVVDYLQLVIDILEDNYDVNKYWDIKTKIDNSESDLNWRVSFMEFYAATLDGPKKEQINKLNALFNEYYIY